MNDRTEESRSVRNILRGILRAADQDMTEDIYEIIRYINGLETDTRDKNKLVKEKDSLAAKNAVLIAEHDHTYKVIIEQIEKATGLCFDPNSPVLAIKSLIKSYTEYKDAINSLKQCENYNFDYMTPNEISEYIVGELNSLKHYRGTITELSDVLGAESIEVSSLPGIVAKLKSERDLLQSRDVPRDYRPSLSKYINFVTELKRCIGDDCIGMTLDDLLEKLKDRLASSVPNLAFECLREVASVLGTYDEETNTVALLDTVDEARSLGKKVTQLQNDLNYISKISERHMPCD